MNYKDHASESGSEAPKYPALFGRFPSSLIGHGAPIVRPRVSEQLEYEGELVAIIGKPGRNISVESALDHVAGYSIFNDASIRDSYQQGTMTMIRSFTPKAKRPGELGVHSLDHFSVSVPKMSVAEEFYAAFGLDLKADGNHLGLTTFESPHRWGALTEGPSKKLQYVSFAAFEEDFAEIRTRVESLG